MHSSSRNSAARTVAPSDVLSVTLLPVLLVLASAVPVARALEGGVSRGWNIAVIIALAALTLLTRVERPAMYGAWVFAGLLALGSIVTSSGGPGFSANVVAGAPLAVMWIAGPPVLRFLAVRSPASIRAVVVAFLIVQTSSALAAIAQATGSTVLGYAATLGRSPGLATHPNLLGIMAAIAICVLLDFIVTARKGRLWAIAALAVNALALVVSGSTSAMLAALTGVAVLMLARGIRLRRVLLVGAAAVLLGTLLVSVTPLAGAFRNPTERFLQVTGQTGEQSTLLGRLDLLAEAFSLISQNPLLGAGLTDEFGAVEDSGTLVHNFPARALLQGGLLLLVAALVLIAAMTRAIILGIIRRRNAGSIGVLAAVLVFSFGSTFFDSAYYWLPVIVAWATLNRDEQPQYSQRPHPLQGTLSPRSQPRPHDSGRHSGDEKHNEWKSQ